jgi:hypothetical protein
MERGIKFTKENAIKYFLRTIIVLIILSIFATPFIIVEEINLQECWNKFNNFSIIEKSLFSFYGSCMLLLCITAGFDSNI